MADVQREISDEVRSFEASLASGVPADRLSALLAPDLPPAVISQMLAQPRFATRLSRMMLSRLDLALPPEISPDLRFAAITASEMGSAICAVGGIWHHHMVRQVIAKATLQSLIDAISLKAYHAALANADLAVTPTGIPAIANLVCSIQRIGRVCVDAWLETLDAPVAELVRLKLPEPPAEKTETTDDHRRFGPAIIQRVANRWAERV